jgi:hypothetical protein
MTRTINSTFIATALAIASLAFAGVAQADEPAAGIAVGEPTPGQLPATTQAEPAPEPEADVDPVVEEEPEAAEETDEPAAEETREETDEETGELDTTSPAYFKTKEALKRFKRYCAMKDAEPSHSDKAFCALFRKHHPKPFPKPLPKPGKTRPATTGTAAGHGTTGTATGTATTRPATDTADAKRTTGSTRPVAATAAEQPVAQTEETSKSSLPFTGFEVWQLALLGVALIGGALAARHLLGNDD